jgi:hypothetical protein
MGTGPTAGRAGREQKPLPAVELLPAPVELPRLAYHHYTLRDVWLFLRLVLQCRAPLRCTARVPEVVSEIGGISLGTPHWTTGRLWLLRLGLYKLTRPKAQANDWVWFVDHSMQVGKTKCLYVVGIRLSALPPSGQPLRHADLEPIELIPVENSTKEIVYEQLAAAATKTGVPCVIVDDHGADLHGGVTLFQQRHPETVELYDIAHKAARLLKRRLERDARWATFCGEVGRIHREVRQTELACLVPPPLGCKARFMNLGPVIRWGEETLRILDNPPAYVRQHLPAERLQAKFNWLRHYATALQEWSQFLVVIETTLEFVREEGLTSESGTTLRIMLDALWLDQPARTLAIELAAFVRDESAKVPPTQRFPASTEVLESCFGKLKALEQQHSLRGFTGLVLSLGALVSDMTVDVIAEALQVTRTKHVWAWCRAILGPTVQSQRKLTYHPT